MNVAADPSNETPHRRRARYSGKNPRTFAEKYKEKDSGRYPETVEKVRARGKTPAGTHRAIMVEEVVSALQLGPGQTGVDATLGWGGHAEALLPRILPGGVLLGLDIDPLERPRTQSRLRDLGFGEDCLRVLGQNFAGLRKAIASEGWEAVDFVLADLGVSSMQLDDPSRGFSYKFDGPLDLRMNPERGPSAASFLSKVSEERLKRILAENSDEPLAGEIAREIVSLRHRAGVKTTADLAGAVRAAAPGGLEDEGKDTLARVFQALRIEVNEEFSALTAFLKDLPHCLRPGGRIVVLTFHSGEDRRVKKAFLEGFRTGIYREVSRRPLRATPEEVRANPRAAPGKLRWAVRA